MAQLIATGTTLVNSSDVIVAAGDSTSISLFTAVGGAIPRGCSASVQKKGSNSQYFEIGVLDDKQPAVLVEGPGTFRVVRKISSISFGVDQE